MSDDDDWFSDNQEDKTLIGRTDVIQLALKSANIQSNGSRKNLTNNLIANKSIKVEPKQPSSPSNVYTMYKKDSIIKLDSTPTNKLSVKGPNQANSSSMLIVRNNSPVTGRKPVVSSSIYKNSVTPGKVTIKPDGTQIIQEMHVITNKSSPTKPGANVKTNMKNEPIKIQPRPDSNQLQQQYQLVTAIQNPVNVQAQRSLPTTTTTAQTKTIGVGQRSDTGNQRPLLPKITSTGRFTISTTTTQAQSNMRSLQQPQYRQGLGQSSTLPQQQQQRTTVQKRVTTIVPTSTLSGSSVHQPKPKVTIPNSQSVKNKLFPSPAMGQVQNKVSPKVTPTGRSQTTLTTTQQKMMVKKKIFTEAGTVQKSLGRSPSVKSSSTVRAKPNTLVNKPKESKLAVTDGLHMEFHEVGESEESGCEAELELPTSENVQSSSARHESPPPQMSLCPHTGQLIGPDGKPIEPVHQEPEPESSEPTPMAIVVASEAVVSGTATIGVDGIITSNSTNKTNELVLPNLESFSDGAGGIVSVEMSPGGTTGVILQTNEASSTSGTVPGPDMPSLDDSSVEIQTSAGQVIVNVVPLPASETMSSTDNTIITTLAEATTPLPPTTTTATTTEQSSDILTGSFDIAMLMPKQETITPTITSSDINTEVGSIKLEENGGVMTITGDNGVSYQVAGQSENGQTLLLAQSGDGEQQYVYALTTDQDVPDEDGQVMTFDQAMAHLLPDQVGSQFYVKEDGTETTMETSDVTNPDNQQLVIYNTNAVEDNGDNQLVANVISSEEPNEGNFFI